MPQPAPPQSVSITPERMRWVVPTLIAVAVIAIVSLVGLTLLLVSALTGDRPMATDPVSTIGEPAPTSIPPTGGETAYVEALDYLERALAYTDGSLPALGDEIDGAAPDVPTWVDDELAALEIDIDEAMNALAAQEPPPAYTDANEAIFGAGDAMLIRIDQARQGIQTMWVTGSADTGTSFFEGARQARDRYRVLFDRYQRARP